MPGGHDQEGQSMRRHVRTGVIWGAAWLAAGVGYFQANEKGLVGFLGTPQALARKYAGRWISFPPGGMGYQRVVSGVTIGAVADQLELTGEISQTGAATVDGQAVQGLTGGSPVAWNAPAGVSAKLYVAASGQAPARRATDPRRSWARTSPFPGAWCNNGTAKPDAMSDPLARFRPRSRLAEGWGH
jgi:hypothetical protein